MKHRNMTGTQRYNNTQFILMNEIYRNCKNPEKNELDRMMVAYL
jgi:hypothetical protein